MVPRGPLCLTLLPVPVSFLVITISLSSTDPPPTIPVTVFFLVPALGRVLLPWKDGPWSDPRGLLQQKRFSIHTNIIVKYCYMTLLRSSNIYWLTVSVRVVASKRFSIATNTILILMLLSVGTVGTFKHQCWIIFINSNLRAQSLKTCRRIT